MYAKGGQSVAYQKDGTEGGIAMKKAEYLIVLVVLAVYMCIGYIFDIDVLKIFVVGIDEYSISLVGVVIWYSTVKFIQYIRKTRPE